MQGFNAGFDVCEFIMSACYPEAGMVVGPLLSQNISLDEFLEVTRQRKRRLEEALELVDLYFPCCLRIEFLCFNFIPFVCYFALLVLLCNTLYVLEALLCRKCLYES